ncbi:MAG: TetR family transcriptional regulator [Robiginitomaculum sp.]|nr:MAG: TetR family transcriptional regulator [Robiginitomaculum sp.]
MADMHDIKPRWQRQPAERPGQILDAALIVFRARGFGAARMDEIARKAGISKGTIYLYFDSKNALLEALIDRAMTPVAAHLKMMADAGGQGPIAPVLRAMLSFAAQRLGDPATGAIPLLVISEAVRFPELAQVYRTNVIDVGLGAVMALIKAGVKSGEFRPHPPEHMARLFVAPMIMQIIWNGVFIRPKETPLDAQALIAQHIDIFLNGILQKGAREVRT